MFRDDIKAQHPHFRFEELEQFGEKYDTRYYERVIPIKRKRNQLLGHKGMLFLLQTLVRSKSLFTGFVDCVNHAHVILAYLATRAHFETTGSVAYLLWHLRRYYAGEISQPEVETTLDRLALGAKDPSVKDIHSERIEAVNVLTQMGRTDALFQAVGGEDQRIFRKCYEFLSEFCHPNVLGLIAGSDVTQDKHMVLYESPQFRGDDFATLINYMLITCRSFFWSYDNCFSLLKDNEQLPDLVKH